METNTLLFAFGLTLFAGLSTGVGSALAFFTRRTNTRFLSVALGFSAGVMLYVSFVEIIVKARNALVSAFAVSHPEEVAIRYASWSTAGAFFGGIFFIALIDKLIPSYENPHEIHRVEEMSDGDEAMEYEVTPEHEQRDIQARKLFRMGLFTALAIAIHNFPEGLATFTAALSNPALGIPIAIAIAIHNVPEGIAVSIPIYFATGDRKKAFFYSFASGLAEPLGALIGYIILYRFFNDIIFGVLFASVAGIMVFISLDELFPVAREYGEHHLAIYGLVSGMAVMAVSLLLFL